ncbi:hypothetical protein VK66_20400 [Stenotrophomonas maltophilia]|nr:hypothetical protein CEQ03_05385 [Stenotrophomonas maltophilia]KOO74816.1 hypothetical protein VK66_20400 [Stenotrophomonas maltophilia]
MLAVAAISGQAWWYHPTTPTTEITMEASTRLDTLERAVIALQTQNSQIVASLTDVTEAINIAFKDLYLSEQKKDGMWAAQRAIIESLLAHADAATRQYAQAKLQVAYEVWDAKNRDPEFLEEFAAAARSVFPDIRLEPAAE